MQHLDDAELVRRFQRGEAQAFAVFSERHRDRLYRLAVGWTSDAYLAQDAVQESLARSYTGLGRFRFRSEPATWLYRVCRNICHELQRKQGPLASDSELESLADPEDATRAETGAVPRYLTRAIAALPQRQRDVVVLRLLDDRSVRDTARIMGCREGTVKAHLAKGLKNLEKYLNEDRDA